MGLGISVAPAAQGKGVGTALMAALCDYADKWIGAMRIELTVYADNDVALRLYEKFGFVPLARPEIFMEINRPGIYLAGEFGIRIEDMVAVTADGGQVLTPAAKALIEL